MNKITFKLKTGEEYIQLLMLLKIKQMAQTGGHAKIIIENGLVKVNGEIEFRKRKKLRKGDLVELDDSIIEIIT
ncbi:MAG: RNA-binding S4 domain-containing protein [Flavobacteriales bacterium]|nr:RNA-binding S4 domain-containing protein [Flavobacteriales bacterium]